MSNVAKRYMITAVALLLLGGGAHAAETGTASDARTLLTIPFEDRDDLLRVMRGNLDQVRQVVEALAKDDFAAVENIADQMSFNKKKGDGLARRGNPGFSAMGVQFHAVNAAALKAAAQSRDRARTLTALGTTLGTCTGCHAAYKLVEWPDNKTYAQPAPVPLKLPEGATWRE